MKKLSRANRLSLSLESSQSSQGSSTCVCVCFFLIYTFVCCDVNDVILSNICFCYRFSAWFMRANELCFNFGPTCDCLVYVLLKGGDPFFLPLSTIQNIYICSLGSTLFCRFTFFVLSSFFSCFIYLVCVVFIRLYDVKLSCVKLHSYILFLTEIESFLSLSLIQSLIV